MENANSKCRKRLVRISDGKVMSPREEWIIALRAMSELELAEQSNLIQDSAKAAMESVPSYSRVILESTIKDLQSRRYSIGDIIAREIITKAAMFAAAEMEEAG